MIDPISIIVAALIAGASASIKEVAGAGVKDAYNGLKALIARKFAGDAKAEATLADHEEDPETYEKPLKKALKQTGADQDQLILQAAQHLLEQINAHSAPASKYNTTFQGTVERVAQGDHMTIDMSEHHGAKAASEGKDAPDKEK